MGAVMQSEGRGESPASFSILEKIAVEVLLGHCPGPALDC